MKIRMMPSIIAIAWVLITAIPIPAFAAASLSISPAGTDVFSLDGAGFAGVAGVDIAITYDATTLANPQVTKGRLLGNAMVAVNGQTPGVIRIAGVTTSPISGSGSLATITFTRYGTALGAITALSAKLATLNGASIAVQTFVNNSNSTGGGLLSGPGGASASQVAGSVGSSSGNDGGSKGSPAGSGTPIILGGTVTMPSDGTAKNEKIREDAPSKEETPQKEAVQPSTEPQRDEERKEPEKPLQSSLKGRGAVVHKSILDRFKEYEGERTAVAFLAMFERQDAGEFRQEPAIGLADGESVVKLVMNLDAAAEAPNFVLHGARLISLKKGERYSWVITALPDKGSYQASVTALNNGAMIEFPLTVAPPVDVGLNKVGKAEDPLERYIRETGAGASLSGLNKDGKRNYLGDYIFTANYISKLKNIPK